MDMTFSYGFYKKIVTDSSRHVCSCCSSQLSYFTFMFYYFYRFLLSSCVRQLLIKFMMMMMMMVLDVQRRRSCRVTWSWNQRGRWKPAPDSSSSSPCPAFRCRVWRGHSTVSRWTPPWSRPAPNWLRCRWRSVRWRTPVSMKSPRPTRSELTQSASPSSSTVCICSSFFIDYCYRLIVLLIYWFIKLLINWVIYLFNYLHILIYLSTVE